MDKDKNDYVKHYHIYHLLLGLLVFEQSRKINVVFSMLFHDIS